MSGSLAASPPGIPSLNQSAPLNCTGLSASGSDGEDGAAYVTGKRERARQDTVGARRQRRLRGAERSERPYKRPRIDNGDLDGDVSMSGSRSGSASASGEDVDAREEKARTRTPEMMSVSMPVSPFPRPSASQFQSSTSSSSSSSPFPTTPPSNASSSTFVPNVASMSQPFWLDDGDLVLLISPSPSLSPSPSSSSPSTSTSLSIFSSSQFSRPIFPSSPASPPSFFPFFPSSNTLHESQDPPPPTTSAFRIHAARLALASSAFASLLTTPLPTSPSREDSARSAREIAGRLRLRSQVPGACEIGSGNDSVGVKDGRNGVHTGRARGDEEEYIGGCPAVRLEGDAPRDWVVAFEAIYEPMSFQIRPVVFDTLAGALRVSTRYGVRQLREWAIAQLRTTWPSNVERMAPVALPYAADAIALARACDVPDILPAAFYALAVQRWRPSRSHSPGPGPGSGFGSCIGSGMRSPVLPGSGSRFGAEAGGTDGGRAHAVLSPPDLRRLVAGREALQDVLVEIVASPLVVGGSMWARDETGEGGGIGEMVITTDRNGNATYPPSPAPSPSPKTPVLTPALASPAHSDASTTTMVSVSVSSTFHQPSPAPTRPFAPFSFSSPSASTLTAFPSSAITTSTSIGFGLSYGDAKTLPSASPSTPSTPHFTFCSPSSAPCRGALEALWRARLVPDGRRAWGAWLARELHRLATLPRAEFVFQHTAGVGYGFGCEDVGYGYGAGYGGYGSTPLAEENGNENGGEVGGGGGNGKGQGQAPVCVRCWEENRRLALWRLDWLCAAIPGMFML